MKTPTRFELRPIAELIPYSQNAKTHPPEQIEALRRSLRAFGFVSPVLIDGAGNVIAGHGRLLAAQAEGETMAPCVLVEHLTDAQRRAYVLADNKLTELGAWDPEILRGQMIVLRDAGIDLTLTGFDPAGLRLDPEDPEPFWGDMETESSEEYEDFVEKFKPKLTTDDVYTPDNIYETVRDWALAHYELQGAPVIRPFYPGGDYRSADYPVGCVVIDNPPFSILSEICAWYEEHGVRYFLFAPGLTLFSINSGRSRYLPIGASIEYTNGASIATSFVTNMGPWRIELCPDLYAAIETANRGNLAKPHKSFPVYTYPAAVASVAMNKLVKWGQAMQIQDCEAAFIRALDAQRECGKAIYGGGFLLCTKAAAEKAAAENPDTDWILSSRELELIAAMDREAAHD